MKQYSRTTQVWAAKITAIRVITTEDLNNEIARGLPTCLLSNPGDALLTLEQHEDVGDYGALAGHEVEAAWMELNAPEVGGYFIKPDNDDEYYTYLSATDFHRNYQ